MIFYKNKFENLINIIIKNNFEIENFEPIFVEDDKDVKLFAVEQLTGALLLVQNCEYLF
jgi:hypothetical protein